MGSGSPPEGTRIPETAGIGIRKAGCELRSGPREGVELVCPFCRTGLKRPTQLRLSAAEAVAGGTCTGCGAIYLLDPTGKNVGEVMMQGLTLAADRLSMDMSSMVPGEDYEDVVLSYDWRTHRSSGEASNIIDHSGRLYVIRVKKKN